MPDSFDDRFSGLPVDAPNAPLISNIVGNAQINSPQINLVPVDYDPFPKTVRKRGLEAFNEEPPSEMVRPDAPLADKAFGLNDKERYQFFPERLARSVYDVMSGQVAPYNPSTGEYNVEGALDVAGLMGGAPLGIKPGTATLGSGAVRPIMNANKNEVAPVFFSAVEKAVTDISQPKMTGQQWLGTLSNKPGVKPEELDWIGLKDYLKENADKVVTKQEIQSHVEANKVELKDVDKGKTFNYPHKTHDQWETAIMEAEQKKDWDEVNRLNLAWEQSEGQGHGGPKYAKWQLPGGENYREKLLTLPEKPISTKNWSAEHDPNGYKNDWLIKNEKGETVAVRTGSTAEDALNAATKNLDGQVKNTYKSSHWDEPNVLAHVRMNDRTMNDRTVQGEGFTVRNKLNGNTSQVFPTEEAAKAYAAKNFPDTYLSKFEYVPATRPVKSLHIEEIQSDWHQQGRQQGYKGNNDIIKRQAEIEKQLDTMIKNKNEGDTSIEHMRKLEANPDYLKLREELFNNQKAEYAEKNALPDAPFKKTWHELALKRMLREAAEKGYDRLSWTPGEAQAARYDLSKQIQQINFHIDEPGKGTLLAYDHKGETVLNKQITNAEKELPDIIGKEATKKLLEQKPKEKLGSTRKEQSLTGLELKIGGEGMKGFYDQIIPKALEKIGKEHGVKVKQGEIKVNDEGFLSGSDIMDRLGIHKQDQAKYWENLTQKERDDLFAKHRHRKEPIQYIDIPQSLKDQAMHKGFPLFSGGFLLNPVNHDPFKENK